MKVQAEPNVQVADEVRPISVRVRRAVELTGLSRTKIYELIKSGEIKIVKVGATTLIPFESLAALVKDRGR